MTACVGEDIAPISLIDSRVQITEYPEQLKVGESFMLKAEYFDSLGTPVTRNLTWTSSNNQLATVDSSGKLTAIDTGTVVIKVNVGSVSDSVSIMISKDETIVVVTMRSGTLMGRSGYKISGNFRVFREGDKVKLEVSNAQIDNSAPGPFYYLSNQQNSISGALSFGKASNGNATYELPAGTTVSTYNYLLVWCDPFNVLLGYGQLSN
jgi:hypothetical protein